MELNPKYPQAAAWYAMFVRSFIDGQFDEAVALMTPIVELDPLSGYNRRPSEPDGGAGDRFGVE